MPGIAATALICFIFSWNEMLFARVLTGVVAGTAPVFLTGFITSQGLFLAKVCAAVARHLPAGARRRVRRPGQAGPGPVPRSRQMKAAVIEPAGQGRRRHRGRTRHAGPARGASSRSRPAGCAAPICTSSRASSPRRCRSCPATSSPVRSSASAAQVTELAVGDRVAVDPSLYCHECHYCRHRPQQPLRTLGRDRRHHGRRRRRVRRRARSPTAYKLPEHVAPRTPR